MTILYAPSLRKESDIIHANCFCTYDLQILEILTQNSEGGGHNAILYLPHKDTPIKYHKVILDALSTYPITQISSLKEAQDSELLVTDTANIALAFSLFFLKPSLIHLPGFTNIDFGDFSHDEFYITLQKIAYFTNSLKELKTTLNNLKQTKDSKIKDIEAFLQGELL